MPSPIKKALGLTPQQALFVEAYIAANFEGKAAAIAAGCPEGSAAQTASRWLTKPHVLAAVQAAQLKQLRANKVDAGWIKRALLTVKEDVERAQAPKINPRTGKPVLVNGKPVFVYDAAPVLRCIELLGKLTSVQAFEERIVHDASASLVDRLNAGRARARAGDGALDITPRLPR